LAFRFGDGCLSTPHSVIQAWTFAALYLKNRKQFLARCQEFRSSRMLLAVLDGEWVK
jgi:hypothetical protein